MIMLDIPLVYSIAVVITCTWHNHFVISDTSVCWLLAYQNRQWLYKMMSCILLILEYSRVVIVTFTSWLQSGIYGT